MKNQETLAIEMKTLNDLYENENLEEADKVATRMLTDYNSFDYELLITRASIRKDLKQLDNAVSDAHLALSILPQRVEAYQILFKCYSEQNKIKETFKILEILKTSRREDESLRGLYDNLKKQVNEQSNTKFQLQMPDSKLPSTQMRAFLEDEMGQPIQPKLTERQKLLVNDDHTVNLSEEMSSEEDEEEEKKSSKETPGNAQHLETPPLSQGDSLYVDFEKHQVQEWAIKRESYWRPDLLPDIDCSFCQLVLDYTKSCNHNDDVAADVDELKKVIPSFQSSQDINIKKEALKRVTKSLDVMSSYKLTSMSLLTGQFQKIISPFLKTKYLQLFNSETQTLCKDCLPDPPTPYMVSDQILCIINRSLTFQLRALVKRQQDLLYVSLNEGEEPNKNYGVDNEILKGLMEQVNDYFPKNDFKVMQLLIRALSNALLIAEDQLVTLTIMVQGKNLINQVMQKLFEVKEGTYFEVLFAIHAFRFLAITSSINPALITSIERPSLKQLLRKYKSLDLAYPNNYHVVNALDQEFLWFNHSENCSLVSYKSKKTGLRVCGGCGKIGMELKMCSRCRQIWYCSRDCQKKDYPEHKKICASSE